MIYGKIILKKIQNWYNFLNSFIMYYAIIDMSVKNKYKYKYIYIYMTIIFLIHLIQVSAFEHFINKIPQR